MNDKQILIPEFLSLGSDGDAVVYAACTWVCEIQCEVDYEACGECEVCEAACQVTCQNACQSGCQSACEASSQVVHSAPEFSVGNVTQTSATISVSVVDWASQYRVYVRYDNDPDSKVFDQTYTRSGDFEIEVSGLSSGTVYAVNVQGISGSEKLWGAKDTFTTLDNTRPQYWSWTSGLVSSKPTANALSSGDNIPAYLTAAGWTAFVQNIQDVYSYAMGTSYSGILSDGGSGATKLSAAMVNEAIAAIGTMTSSYLPSQTTSNATKLSASLLNGLADSLNSVT